MLFGTPLTVKKAYLKRGEEMKEVKAIRKLYVGGFGNEVGRSLLLEYFSKFGKVSNVYIFYDPNGHVVKSKTLKLA
jgi:RNA recognition motif-containing protein